jgi:ubiquinone/menaquinone biosynthesis C-methylase UbiE
MDALTPEEKVNLGTFSQPDAVEKLYNKEGLTALENRIVDAYFGGSGRVLDIGCGTGRTTLPLVLRGLDATGIDVSSEMIEFAKKKHPAIDYRVMNACHLDFDDETFEYAFFSFNGLDCIYPKTKRLLCLCEVHRVLKKDGIFAFTSHNALCLPFNRILLGIIKLNLFNQRLFTSYRLELSPTGPLLLYYGIPFVEKKNLEKCGFDVLAVTGERPNRVLRMFFDITLFYIVKKMH